jgi:hypothetical protein
VYSVGKNEIQSLLRREEQLKHELLEIAEKAKQVSICSFRELAIKREMSMIQTKLKVLSFGSNFDDDGDIA